MSAMEAIVNPRMPGSLLDADYPVYGVLISCRITTELLDELLSTVPLLSF